MAQPRKRVEAIFAVTSDTVLPQAILHGKKVYYKNQNTIELCKVRGHHLRRRKENIIRPILDKKWIALL